MGRIYRTFGLTLAVGIPSGYYYLTRPFPKQDVSNIPEY
jgi:hypothetical protein